MWKDYRNMARQTFQERFGDYVLELGAESDIPPQEINVLLRLDPLFALDVAVKSLAGKQVEVPERLHAKLRRAGIVVPSVKDRDETPPE